MTLRRSTPPVAEAIPVGDRLDGLAAGDPESTGRVTDRHQRRDLVTALRDPEFGEDLLGVHPDHRGEHGAEAVRASREAEVLDRGVDARVETADVEWAVITSTGTSARCSAR